MNRTRIIAAAAALVLLMTAPAYGAASKIENIQVKASLSAGAESITVKWKKVKAADGYQIYRAASKNGKFKKAATVKNAATVKYVNKKLKAGKTYYFKVRAFQKAGKKTKYSKFSQVKSKAPLTKKAFAKKCIGKKVKVLIAAIGQPYYRDYEQSCFGPGEDGLLKYKGFKVYTYREKGKETVQSVE